MNYAIQVTGDGGFALAREFETLDEAIAELVKEMKSHTFGAMNMPEAARPHLEPILNMQVMTLERALDHRHRDMSAESLVKAFRRSGSGSMRLTGHVMLYESQMGFVHGIVQGKREIEKYLKTSEMQELQGVLNSMGADSVTSDGIRLQGRKSK